MFRYCNSLTSVTIPNSVKEIGHWAFGSDNKDLVVTFLGTEDEWATIVKGNGVSTVNVVCVNENV